MKKKLVSLFVSMAVLLITFVLTPYQAHSQTVLKLAHITAPGGMLDKRAQKFAELVGKKTKWKSKDRDLPGPAAWQHQGDSSGHLHGNH
jgi:TRAP-type C4-dicarboxylate transport system substrate-binding protein